jgi:hypothetical protein
MSAVELLEEALSVASRIGYRIRSEHLGETRSGACEIAGRKWFFLDLTLNSVEQLELVLDALRADAAIQSAPMSKALRKAIAQKQAA